MINVEDGCKASLFNVNMLDSVIICPILETIVGNVRVQYLRELKDVIVPNNIERIGNWFWKAEIESVTVPASVREIGADAFYRCK